MAEATVAVSGEMRDSYHAEAGLVCCGQALGDQQLLVVDTEGTPRPAGVTGEIWIQGESVAQGYWRSPSESERTFRAKLANGSGPYLRTGDLGFVDADGYLTINGRLKDLIIVRGQNFYPQDLEATLEETIPSLRPGCTIVVNGEQGLLVSCETRESLSEFEEIGGLARAALGENYGLALSGVFVLARGDTPKTASGKLRRARISELHQENLIKTIWRWERPARDKSVT